MRVDNYSYRPAFQRLFMDENTTEYIAKNAPRETLPRIAEICNYLQNSNLSIFSIDSSKGYLEANYRNEMTKGYPRSSTITGTGKASIPGVFEACLGYVRDRLEVPLSGKATDYMKEFEKYISA